MRKLILILVIVLAAVPVVQAAPPTPAPNTPHQEVGDTRVDDKGIEQVWVPAGCFMMGTSESEAEYALSLDGPSWATNRIPSEQPQHEVCLSEGYWIDKYEVTNEAFEAFVDDGGYANDEYWSERGLRWRNRTRGDAPIDCETQEADHPRACITWYEAEAYANWRGGSIPTEAQWEFAARSPESFIYPWGNEWVAENANVVGSESTSPVGSFPDGASWVGAEDMAGNVMEWVADWLDPTYYALEERDDPQGAESGLIKIEKGGWWGSNPVVARSAYRHFEDPQTYEDHHIGVRLMSVAEAEAE